MVDNRHELVLEVEEPGFLTTSLETGSSSSPDQTKRVTFQAPGGAAESANDAHWRYHGNPPSNDSSSLSSSSAGDEEVLKCTSSVSFRKQTTLQRIRTRSRLVDAPEEPELDRPQHWSGEDHNDGDMPIEEELGDGHKKCWSFRPLFVLQWASLVALVGALVITAATPELRAKEIRKLELWKWEILVLVLICGRLFSGWLIRVLVLAIEHNFILRRRVLYFVYGVRDAVQNTVWSALVLVAWHGLFDEKVQADPDSKKLKYVTKFLACLLIGTLLWLSKTLIIKLLASSFHVSTYFDRIHESLFNQYVIKTLSGPPIMEILREEEEEEIGAESLDKAQPGLKPAILHTKSGRVTRIPASPKMKNMRCSWTPPRKGCSNDGITLHRLQKLNAKKMKKLISIIRDGYISTLDEQIPDSLNEDEPTSSIRSENEAKAAARKIFQNVAKPGAEFIELEDMMRFMSEVEALKTMSLFEGGSESKQISKTYLKNWLVYAFRERRALALTLNDTKTAVQKLNQVLTLVVVLVIVIVWLLVLGIVKHSFLYFISSQFLLVAFIFGNTLKTVFEAIIFLFVMHPFDVGDRVEVDSTQIIVEEMNILTTVFLRSDNLKVVYPNSTLATKAISNYYRSPDMSEIIEFCVHIATPSEKIGALKQRISSYIQSKSEHWHPKHTIFMKEGLDLTHMKMAIRGLRHRMNYQNMLERFTRRGFLIEEIIKIIKELDIQYQLDVNIRDMPSNFNRVPPAWA